MTTRRVIFVDPDLWTRNAHHQDPDQDNTTEPRLTVVRDQHGEPTTLEANQHQQLNSSTTHRVAHK